MTDLLKDKNAAIIDYQMERGKIVSDRDQLEELAKKAVLLELDMVAELIRKGDFERAKVNLLSARSILEDFT